jgi:hypothetical protein
MIHPFAHFGGPTMAEASLGEAPPARFERPYREFGAVLRDQGAALRRVSTAGPGRFRVDIQPTAAETRAPLPGRVGGRREDTGGEATQTGPVGPVGPPVPPDGPRPAPFVPRFAEVPESARWPVGPYRQAPPEYGGEWWLVNPFTGPEPWLILDRPAPGLPPGTESLPEDFVRVFGEQPTRRAGESGADFQARLSRWRQDLEFFQQAGIPEGFDQAQVDLAASVYEQWGMGRPAFYEGRYGWFARFPDSQIPDFEMDAASALTASHLAIARYQVRLVQEGITPVERHPFVPAWLFEQQA